MAQELVEGVGVDGRPDDRSKVDNLAHSGKHLARGLAVWRYFIPDFHFSGCSPKVSTAEPKPSR